MTLGAGEVTDLLDRHGIHLSKSRGQHLVVDPNTVRRIARLAGVGAGDRVVEIGPGAGALTLALAETGASVTAVEIDAGLVALLGEVLAGRGVRLVHADALTVDWTALLPGGGWVLVANLPYNVATPLVLDVLAGVDAVDRLLVMVQKEVGERMVAPPGDRHRGAVSVKVEARAEAEVVGAVPRSVFLPRPDVDSVLVSLRRRPHPDLGAVPVEAVTSLASRAFGQRRKMLRRSLAGVLDGAAIEGAGVDPTARPETVALAGWAALATMAGP